LEASGYWWPGAKCLVERLFTPLGHLNDAEEFRLNWRTYIIDPCRIRRIAHLFIENVGAGTRIQFASLKYSGGVSTINGASELNKRIFALFEAQRNQP